MKTLILVIAVCFGFTAFGQRISDLPAADTVGGVDLFPVVQGGVTKKLQFDSLSKYINNDSYFTRDAVNGEIYPKTLTDQVGIGTADPNEQLEITGNFRFPASTATTGIIYKGADRWAHNYNKSGTDGYNCFVGTLAGSLTYTGATSGNDGSYNTGFGHFAGYNLTTGYQNVFVGASSGSQNTTGYQNVFIGMSAGKNVTTGYSLVAIGTSAMENATDSACTSVAVGNSALKNTNRGCNVGLGGSTLMDLTLGLDNIAIGSGAGLHRVRGDGNIAIGVYSQGRYLMADSAINGNGNNSVGTYTLASLTQGSFNTVMGDSAGYTLTTASRNIFLGAKAGFNTVASNRLIVDNTRRGSAALDTTSALLFGNFAYPRLTINGQLFVVKGGYNWLHSWEATGTSGRNVFIGTNSGNMTLSGSDAGDEGSANQGLGAYTLYSLTTGKFNTAIGDYAHYSNTSGNYNVGIGNGALKFYATPSNNTAVGYLSMVGDGTPGNNIGGNNAAFGDRSLTANMSGDLNISVGAFSGYANTTGDNNTYLGGFSGFSNSTGASNVFLGFKAGYNETGSNTLYINNDDSTAAYSLIYGLFSPTPYVNIRGKLSVAATNPGGALPSDNFTVTGTSLMTSDLTLNGNFIYEPPHAFYSYTTTGNDTIGGSSAGNDVSLTQWAWTKFGLGLTTVKEHLFSKIAVDTIKYTGTLAAHIRFELTLTVTGANGQDFEIAVMNVTDGANTPIPTRKGQTTTGATNLTGVDVQCYDINANPNDKYVIKIKNRSASAPLTFFYGDVFCWAVHFE